MRKQLLVVLLPLLVLIATAETPNAVRDTTTHAALQKVDVMRGNDGISVEMTARGQLLPTVSTLSSPARVLVTLPNTVAATSHNQVSVDSEAVKGVRIGMDGHTPPTTSVVIDLLRACTYELVPGDDGKVVVKLHPVSDSAKTAKPVAAPETAKVPASIHRTALQPVSLHKPAALRTPGPVAVAPAPGEKAAPSASSASDFVFVEPSYQAKTENENRTQPARAITAAAKFVDKPEGSLLPAPSATIQEATQAANATPMQPAVNLAAEQKTQSAQPVSAPEQKYTGEPISVNLKDVDLKDFFRLIHEISGLNVVLDPGNGQGSAQHDTGARHRRHDLHARDARNALRARARGHRVFHRWRRHRRIGSAGGSVRSTEGRPDPRFPVADTLACLLRSRIDAHFPCFER